MASRRRPEHRERPSRSCWPSPRSVRRRSEPRLEARSTPTSRSPTAPRVNDSPTSSPCQGRSIQIPSGSVVTAEAGVKVATWLNATPTVSIAASAAPPKLLRTRVVTFRSLHQSLSPTCTRAGRSSSACHRGKPSRSRLADMSESAHPTSWPGAGVVDSTAGPAGCCSG